MLGNFLYPEPQLDRGYIQVHYGSPAGLPQAPDQLVKGRNNYGSFGSNLATLDYNNDGVDDLLVEARFDELLEGRIYIFAGNPHFNPENPAYTLACPGSESLYYCFTCDMNGDGLLDIICRSNRNWDTHQTEVYVFYGGGRGNRPDHVVHTGFYIPMLFTTGHEGRDLLTLGSINMKDQRKVTRLALINSKQYTSLDFSLPGSVDNTVIPFNDTGSFFVHTSVAPVELLQYKIRRPDYTPYLYGKINLPGQFVTAHYGMVFADFNGDKKKELAIAYADQGRGKLVVMDWE